LFEPILGINFWFGSLLAACDDSTAA